MERSLEIHDNEDTVQVVDIKKLHRTFHVEDEISIFDMTSLGALMLLEQTTYKHTENELIDDDTYLNRVSLAYERLHSMPKILLEELAPHVKILDISHNEFDNLDFLSDFQELTSLICDHNEITSRTSIPLLPKLELLWMNHCKISELYPWARKLRNSCPNLKYLSLMGNPVAPSYLNGGSFYEHLHYRLFIISLFPNLLHFDDRGVTPDQKKEAQKLYHRPLMERIVTKTQQHLPGYLRIVSEKFSEMLSPTPPFSPPSEKNLII